MLIAPPAIETGAFNYYGAVLLPVGHGRWAGLAVGITARPMSCGSEVLHTHAVQAAADQILRTTVLENASVARG